MRRAAVVVILIAQAAEARPRRVDIDVDAPDPGAAALQVLGPGAELLELSVRRSLTGVHVRYRTLAADGTRVLDQDAAVHLRGNGPRWRARLVDDPGRGVWTVAGKRRIRADEARGLAERATGGTARSAEEVALPVAPHLARPGVRVLVDTFEPRRLLEVRVDAD